MRHLKTDLQELYDSIKRTRIQTKDHNDSLIDQVNSKTVENADLKAQIRERFFANVALKNELRKLKGNNMDTKFVKPSILGKPVLQPPRNQSVVRQPNAFKSASDLPFPKPRFASQVDVNDVLSKPVTPYYLPKVREYVLAKPHHVIAPGSFRNSQEEPLKIKNNNPVEPKNHTHKPGKRNGIGQRFSSIVFACMEKQHTPRSYLRWETNGKNFQAVVLGGYLLEGTSTQVQNSKLMRSSSYDGWTKQFKPTLLHSKDVWTKQFKPRSSSNMSFDKTVSSLRSLLHDNIIPKPDLALELGKSISLTEAEEEAVAREVHATHARIVSGPDPEPVQEDQTGSNSGKLHVSLAGPNPEHMDDEFLATAYPKVHENLKLITDERVLFTTIPDPSHQTVTSNLPVIAPFTDVSSTKPSSLVTPPPINTEATTIITIEQEMSEVKKTDHSTDVLASIKSQVPTVVDKYLGTKLDDALLKILEKRTHCRLIEKYSACLAESPS
ncbi:hypothetical protein Tco_0778740 [Tanacetum coccineum]